MNQERALAIGAVALIVGSSIWSIREHPTQALPPAPPPRYFDPAIIAARCPTPPMPEAARLAHEHGRCRFHVHFDEQGHPDSAEVVESSGYRDLDEYTTRYVLEHWSGEPRSKVDANCVYGE